MPAASRASRFFLISTNSDTQRTTFSAPPQPVAYTDPETGDSAGYELDLLKAAAAQMAENVSFVPIPVRPS